MKRILVACMLALICTSTAQASIRGITASTPGLQIVQLRRQISVDMSVIAHHYRESAKPGPGGWIQLVRVVIDRTRVAEHKRHYVWASRQLQRRWSLLGNVRAWSCIHYNPRTGTGEGSWDDSGDPYWGGLQMNRGFMFRYGADMIRKYHGFANVWHPYDQMIVAQRALRSGRGYYPWPNTARACGLI